MARTSGAAGQASAAESFARAAFTHAASGFRYTVTHTAGGDEVEFEKTGGGDLRGKKTLAYFVGSGATARSYLLADGGFLYEAPVTYYSASARWDLAPSYETYAYPLVTRPIMPACLTCHASFLNVVEGTQNRYGTPPFAEGGVACERCHGPGEAHIEKMKAGGRGDTAIVNPAKLAPDRRDSICAQCHLSGEVRVMRPGATWQSYHPGERLADSMTVFVRAGNAGMRVTSHFEDLARSACQKASGGRLWCGSCHDPHVVPEPAARAGWFRAKCRNCHADAACTETRAVRAERHDDCIGCHMPKNPVGDAQHVVYTDHSIPRRPVGATVPAGEVELVAFRGASAARRDWALAYAIEAGRVHTPGMQKRARELLESAARDSPDDAEVLLYLGEMDRNEGREQEAIPLYRRAMRLDPFQVTASVGLGSILFERGDSAEAIRLWQDALARNGGLVLVATDLAMAQWRIGERAAAEATLRRVIELSPAFEPARDLMKSFEGVKGK
jgi:hypothetical protein